MTTKRLNIDTKLEAITQGGEVFIIDFDQDANALIISNEGEVLPCELKAIKGTWCAWVSATVASNLLGRKVDQDAAIRLHTSASNGVALMVARADGKAQRIKDDASFRDGIESLHMMGNEAITFRLNQGLAFAQGKGPAIVAANRIAKEIGARRFDWDQTNALLHDDLPSATVSASALLAMYESAKTATVKADEDARAKGYESSVDRIAAKERTIYNLTHLDD